MMIGGPSFGTAYPPQFSAKKDKQAQTETKETKRDAREREQENRQTSDRSVRVARDLSEWSGDDED